MPKVYRVDVKFSPSFEKIPMMQKTAPNGYRVDVAYSPSFQVIPRNQPGRAPRYQTDEPPTPSYSDPFAAQREARLKRYLSRSRYT